MICERCGTSTNAHTMSVFNTDEICIPCRRTEELHPDFASAHAAEAAAVRDGDYNFPGVGLPSDLRRLS